MPRTYVVGPAWLWALIALGAAVAAAASLRGEAYALGVGLAVGSIGLFLGAGGGRILERTAIFPASAIPDQGGRARGFGIVPGAGLLFGLILSVLSWVQFDFDQPSHAAWWLYGAGMCCIMLALWLGAPATARLAPWGRSILHGGWTLPSVHNRHLALGVILLLAAVLRVYDLSGLPFGTWYDEAANGLEALRVANEPNFRPVYNPGVNSSGHYLFLIVAAFHFFGVETESIRLISAVMGVGVTLAAYGVGATLLDYRSGLIFAALVAVSRWAVNFSRIGMYNISTPLFALIALYFALRAVRTGHLSDFGAAGLAAGLGMTFYSAYYLFAPVLAMILLPSLWKANLRSRAWLGLSVFLMVGVVTLAPTAKYAWERPDSYFGRVRTTSLLERTPAEQRLSALMGNTLQHMRMFHVRGDPNGRHNLPGRPMLDVVSGGLVILGLGMCLARPRRLVAWLLPAWLGAALLGGILSLDFESPQSLRSIGALPPVYLLATLPLAGWLALFEARRAHAGGIPTALQALPAIAHRLDKARLPVQGFLRTVAGPVAGPLVISLALGAITWLEVRAYFVEQANDFASWNAFSTPETLAARILAAAMPAAGPEHGDTSNEVDAYVISLYDGHPTIRFLAPQGGRYNRLETTNTLPLLVPPVRDLLLIADADRGYFFEEVRALYPNARLEAVRPPFGGPVILYVMRISVEDQRSIQGARIYYGGAEDEADAREPLGIGFPGSPIEGFDLSGVNTEQSDDINWMEWEGVLRTPSYGPHFFFVEGPGAAELYIGDDLIVSSLGSPVADDDTLEVDGVQLAQGPHRLRIRAALSSPDEAGRVAVYWRTPERAWEPLPPDLVFHHPDHPYGLEGRYFANGDWQDPVTFVRIDGRLEMYFHVLPLARPYTVEWIGLLDIPRAGEYGIGVQSIDESTLWLGDDEIAHSAGGNALAMGRVFLDEGHHPIRIRYGDRTHHSNFRLVWEPPDGSPRTAIPSERLLPPQTDTVRVSAYLGEEFVSLVAHSDRQPGDLLRTTREPVRVQANVEVVVQDLVEPTTIAVGADGTVWVAEPRMGRVRGFSGAGELRATLLGSADSPFVEPYAVAVSLSGTVFVLDAETGVIHRFDDNGLPLGALPVETETLMRSRGLAVEAGTGYLWVAATARGELIQLDEEGRVLQVIPLRAGGANWHASQPTSVARAASGTILVGDPGLELVVVLAADGRRTLAWEITPANTFTGPQLAVGRRDLVYRTAPEEGWLVAHAATGEPVLIWMLRSHEFPALYPVGVATSESGIIWVVDTLGGQLLRLGDEASEMLDNE